MKVSSGHLYAYRVPFHKVTVTFHDGRTDDKNWFVIKRGRSDPGKVASRVVTQLRSYLNNVPTRLTRAPHESQHQHLPDAEFVEVARTVAKDFQRSRPINVHDDGRSDIMFVHPIDIGQEGAGVAEKDVNFSFSFACSLCSLAARVLWA